MKTAIYSIIAREQIQYMLGDVERRYVGKTRFGGLITAQVPVLSPQIPMTRTTTTLDASAGPNPQLVRGRSVKNDDYVDNRKDLIKNKVAIDCSAGFQFQYELVVVWLTSCFL